MPSVARTLTNVNKFANPASNLFGSHSGVNNFIDPGQRVLTNIKEGGATNFRNVIDPANVILHAPPPPPAPLPTFPDTAGAELNAKRAVRRRALTSGVGSTILTGGYSPTGQASPVLGGQS